MSKSTGVASVDRRADALLPYKQDVPERQHADPWCYMLGLAASLASKGDDSLLTQMESAAGATWGGGAR